MNWFFVLLRTLEDEHSGAFDQLLFFRFGGVAFFLEIR